MLNSPSPAAQGASMFPLLRGASPFVTLASPRRADD